MNKLIFSLPSIPIAMIGIYFYVYLPKHLVDVVGISGTTIGLIILASRIWDACLDPLIGGLSDRTNSRFGRRMPWILIGVLGLGAVFILLTSRLYLVLPTASATVIFFSILITVFFVFWTMVMVPYQTLGAEMSTDYFERTRIFAWRDGAAVLGTILAVIVPVSLAGFTDTDRATWIGISYTLLLFLCTLFFILKIREPALPIRVSTATNPLLNLISLRNNAPYMILALSYLIAGFGSQLPSTLFLFYTESVLGVKEGGFYLLLYFVVGFLFIPVWERLARGRNKRNVWISAMTVNAGAFIGALFLGMGDGLLFYIVVIFSGVGYGAALFLPSSMQADVIEYDKSLTGEDRAGLMSGGWLIASKLAGALGAGIALPIVEMAGYLPGQAQPPLVSTTIRILYAGVPCLCYGVAIIVALRYPLIRNSDGRIGILERHG